MTNWLREIGLQFERVWMRPVKVRRPQTVFGIIELKPLFSQRGFQELHKRSASDEVDWFCLFSDLGKKTATNELKAPDNLQFSMPVVKIKR